jgi:predicted small integral membrane protein
MFADTLQALKAVAVNLAGMALRFPPTALGFPCVATMLSGMAVRLMEVAVDLVETALRFHATAGSPAEKTLAVNESNLPIKNALKKRHK